MGERVIDARNELEAERKWLQTERGRAKVKFKEGDDPGEIWMLDDLIASISCRIDEVDHGA
jgi:hypothetical protein